MKSFFEKNKLYISIIMMFVIVFTLYKFVVIGEIKSISDKFDGIQERIIDSQLNKSKLDKIPEMETANRNLQAGKNYLEVILPEDSEVDFIKTLESLAQSTGNEISFKINEQSDNKNTPAKKPSDNKNNQKKDAPGIMDGISYDKYLSIEINLKGNYQSAVNFVHKIENLNYYVNIVSISMKKEALEIDKNKTSSNNGDMFSVPVANPVNNNQENQQVDQKETLSSIINVIVYLKK